MSPSILGTGKILRERRKYSYVTPQAEKTHLGRALHFDFGLDQTKSVHERSVSEDICRTVAHITWGQRRRGDRKDGGRRERKFIAGAREANRTARNYIGEPALTEAKRVRRHKHRRTSYPSSN